MKGLKINDRKVVINLPTVLYLRLKAKARRKRVPMNKLIKDWIVQWRKMR